MTASNVHLTLKIDTRPFVEGMRRAAAALSDLSDRFHFMGVRLNRPKGGLGAALKGGPKHAARCSICSPFANPAPLSIDGAAYHARARRRTGGRR